MDYISFEKINEKRTHKPPDTEHNIKSTLLLVALRGQAES